MRARESQLASELFGDEDLAKLLPIVRPGGSDSATFDNVLELLVLAGRSLPARDDDDGPGGLRGPRRPARVPQGLLRVPLLPHGAVGRPGGGRVHRRPRDRRDARPQRPAPRALAGDQGRLGRPRLGDRRDGRARLEHRRARAACSPASCSSSTSRRAGSSPTRRSSTRSPPPQPYGDWYEQGVVHLADLPERDPRAPRTEPLRNRQLAFGYSQEDLRVLLAPTAAGAAEPIGSMGNDLALAVLSDRQPPLFSYFKQLFAQVTNPPIDPIRESVVMSVASGVGSEANLFDETPEHAHQLSMPTADPAHRRSSRSCARSTRRSSRRTRSTSRGRRARARTGSPTPSSASARRRPSRSRAASTSSSSPTATSAPSGVPIPSLLAVAARAPPPRARGHAPAGRARARVRRAARGPPLRDADRLRRVGDQPVPDVRVARRARRRRPPARRHDRRRGRGAASSRAIGKGLLKTISKMGISTIQSYCGRADLRGRRPRPAT